MIAFIPTCSMNNFKENWRTGVQQTSLMFCVPYFRGSFLILDWSIREVKSNSLNSYSHKRSWFAWRISHALSTEKWSLKNVCPTTYFISAGKVVFNSMLNLWHFAIKYTKLKLKSLSMIYIVRKEQAFVLSKTSVFPSKFCTNCISATSPAAKPLASTSLASCSIFLRYDKSWKETMFAPSVSIPSWLEEVENNDWYYYGVPCNRHMVL